MRNRKNAKCFKNIYYKQGKNMATKTPIAQTISVDDFKQSAKRLTDILKQKEIPIKHSEALDMMSNTEGYKDYNTFVAAAKIHNEDINSRLNKLLSDFENTEKLMTDYNN